jgi:stage II sporulation protein D
MGKSLLLKLKNRVFQLYQTMIVRDVIIMRTRENFYKLIFAYVPIIFLLLLINIACQAPVKKPPAIPSEAKVKIQPYEFPIKIKEPVIRVGLQIDADMIQLTCTGKFQVVLQDKGEIIEEPSNAKIYFVPKVSKFIIQSSYIIQLGSFANKDNALRLMNEVKEKFKFSSNLILEESNDKFRVKIIGVKSKEEAENIKKKLEDEGYQAWIILEYKSDQDRNKNKNFAILFYDDNDEKKSESSNNIIISPQREEDRILFNSKPYRGAFAIFLNERGKLNLINILNIEDYLKGVLPLEMGSYTYSAIEALKAQALAARTYAVKNMKQFEKEGYDICATPACQVYGGASVEEALSSRAVDETAGEIITYRGEPIDALYTSTCGGHTEDARYIFNKDEPYLKGVPCTYEQQNIYTASSANQFAIIQDEDGFNVTPGLFLLYKLDFFKVKGDEKSYFSEIVTLNEWERWIKKLLIYLDLQPSYKSEVVPQDFFHAILEIAKAIKADEKARLLFPAQVNETLMNFSDAAIADTEAKKIIALFISLKYIRPYYDNTLRLYNPPIRYRVLDVIYRILEHHNVFAKVSATVVEMNNDGIKVKVGSEFYTYKISRDAMFAHAYGDMLGLSNQIKLATGDVINFLGDKNEIYYIEAVWGMQGEASDRSSKYAFWSQFIPSDELANRVNKIKDIGVPIDLIILKQGVSGRVVELLVRGEKGEVSLKGLNIRMTLGLRENWFTIDKVVGKRPGFLFIGRGWGHGVGLCQVGAYGMAVQGRNYREIIKHYYTDVDITKLSN